MMKKKIYRQGDILLILTNELPELENVNIFSIEGPEEENSIILALGESTGHKHQILDTKEKVFLRKSKNSNQFLLLVNDTVDLVHEEHNKITLPKGNYYVVRQRQYTPEKIM